MLLSTNYRIVPTRAQDAALGEMLADFCHLYKAALEQRSAAYDTGVSLPCNAQIVPLPVMRRERAETQGRWSCTAQQHVLRKLDKTFKAFFGRIKRGAKAGFRRFRAHTRTHAADFRVGDGLTLRKSDKLGLVGVSGEIKLRWHRTLPSTPKSAIPTRQAGKGSIIFHLDVDAVARAGPESVGIDLGLAALVALSNGVTVVRPG